MSIVHDTLCDIRKFTLRDTFLDWNQVQNTLLWVPGWDSNAPIPAIIKPIPLWSGKQILSTVIPRGIDIQRAPDPLVHIVFLELTRVTTLKSKSRSTPCLSGIATQRLLVAFHPHMRGALEKLQWASTRATTWQEDIAYSLFGLFGVHLPVIHGKKKHNALRRLLQEIMAQLGDITALDWVGKSSEFNSCLPADITSSISALQASISVGR